MPASETLSKNLRSGSKTSSLTRWWNSNTVSTDTESQQLSEGEFTLTEQALAHISDELLGLGIKIEEPSSKSANKSTNTNKPTHERKLSWPFAGNRKVVPHASVPSGVPSDEGSVSPLASSAPGSGPITPDISYHSNYSQISKSSFDPSEAEHRDFLGAAEVNPSESPTFTGKSPQGYRRLWQSITSVRKGDKVAPTELKTQPQEYTVDSLVRGVMSLKTSQPILEAPRLASGLRTLDSRAVAALLKELSKAGQQTRATELFDYLRSLPEENPLSPLADLYTYTTVISQCGGHQHLRRALELVAEMRGKGIQCNVHTYSALMSVCVKCK